MAFPVKISEDEKENNGFLNGIKNFWNSITGTTSKEIAEKNFNLQQEQFDYQKQLNELLMEREDTAYQRAVKDAQAAGLSAQGIAGANSSALAAGEAPQLNDYASTNFQNGLNLLNSLTQFENNIQQNIISRKRAEADIRKTNAETADIEARTDLFNYQVPFLKIFTDYDYLDKTNRNNFYRKYNSFTGATPFNDYAINTNASREDYANLIRTNEFNNLGLLFSLVSDLGKDLGFNNIYDVKDTLQSVPKVFNNFKDVITDIPIVANNTITLPTKNSTNTDVYKIKGTKHPLAGELYKVQRQFNKMNNTKFRLDFIRDSKMSQRGVLKLYNKKTGKYEAPDFIDLQSINRYLNYGSVKY